jgi:hypothetical protein
VTESEDMALMPSFKEPALEVTLLAADRVDLAMENMVCVSYSVSRKRYKISILCSMWSAD